MLPQSDFNSADTNPANLLLDYNAASAGASYDYLARIWREGGSTDELKIDLTNTSDVVESIVKLLQENKILKKTVQNLWKTVQYGNEYSSFLLGQYTKDEFVKIARQYAELPSVDIKTDELYQAVNVIFSTIDEELSSHDLSTMLNIDCSLIEKTMIDKS